MHSCFSISLKRCQSQSQTSHPHIKTSLDKGNSSCGKELGLVVSTPQTSQGSEWLPWAVRSSCTGTAHHVITADFPPSLCASPPVLPATLLEIWEKVQGTWLWNKVWNPSSMKIHGGSLQHGENFTQNTNSARRSMKLHKISGILWCPKSARYKGLKINIYVGKEEMFISSIFNEFFVSCR